MVDKLVALSVDGPPPKRFFRAQSLLFAILDVIASYLAAAQQSLTRPRHATAYPSLPRQRQFAALRHEALHAAGLLRDELDRRWSMSELAEAVHLWQSQFGRAFVDTPGKSPIAYLAMLRAERMASLLRTSDAPIAVIARQVGWSDADFASHQFRRAVGMTTSHYRTMIVAVRINRPFPVRCAENPLECTCHAMCAGQVR